MPLSLFSGDCERSVEEDSVGKYSPTSPAQLESCGSNFSPEQLEGSPEHWHRPDSPGSAASATYGVGVGVVSRKRPCSEDSVDSGSDQKRQMNRHPLMRIEDPAARKRAIMAMRAYFMGPSKKVKKTAPIAPASLPNNSDQLTKLHHLMLKLGKPAEAQSRIDRDRAILIQEHAQLMASFS